MRLLDVLAVLAVFAHCVDGKVHVEPCGLSVDGKAINIKGIGYSPSLISEDGLHADLYGWSRSSMHDRDLELIAGMGANAIRLWGLKNLKGGYDTFFQKAAQHNLKVMPSFPLNPEVYPDIKSSFAVQQIEIDFRNFVRLHMKHDALLVWLVGNEPNKDRSENGYQDQLNSFIEMFNRLAKIRDEEEGDNPHPMCAPLADRGNFTKVVREYDPIYRGEMWCIQPYRGPTFKDPTNGIDLFVDYITNGNTTKPLLLTEFGADSWDNIHSRDDEEGQAATLKEQWSELQRNLLNTTDEAMAACRLKNETGVVGAMVMEWVDEWWKGAVTDTSNMGICPDPLSSRHRPCGITAKGYIDSHISEEYLGIVRQTNYLTAWCVTPKKSFFVMKEHWGGNAVDDTELLGRACVTVIHPFLGMGLGVIFIIAITSLVCHVRLWWRAVNEEVDLRKNSFQTQQKDRNVIPREELGTMTKTKCVRTCATREKSSESQTQCDWCGNWLHSFCVGVDDPASVPRPYECPNCAGALKEKNPDTLQFLTVLEQHTLSGRDTLPDLRFEEVIRVTTKDTPHGMAENAKFQLHLGLARDLVDSFVTRERYTRTGQPRTTDDEVDAIEWEEAIAIVHREILAGYNKWVGNRSDVKESRLKENALPPRRRAEVILWMAMRSMSEMIFHCPARLAHIYHICVRQSDESVVFDLTSFIDIIYSDMHAVTDKNDTRNFDDIERYPTECNAVMQAPLLAADVTNVAQSTATGKTLVARGSGGPMDMQLSDNFPRVDKYFYEPSGFGVLFVILRNAIPLVSQKLWAFTILALLTGELELRKASHFFFFLVIYGGEGLAVLLAVVVDISLAIPRCRKNNIRAYWPWANRLFLLLDIIFIGSVGVSFMFMNTPLGEIFWMGKLPVISLAYRLVYVSITTVYRMFNLRLSSKDSKANIFFRYVFWLMVVGCTALFEVKLMLSSMLNLRTEFVCDCVILSGDCFDDQQKTLCMCALAVTWMLLFSTFLVTNQAFFVLCISIFGLFTGIRRRLGNVQSGSIKFKYNSLRNQLQNFVGEPKQAEVTADKTRRMYRVLMENVDTATEGFVGVVEALSQGADTSSTTHYVAQLLRIAAQGTRHPFYPHRFHHTCKFVEYKRPATMHALFTKIDAKAKTKLFLSVVELLRGDALRALEPGLRELVYSQHRDGHAFASLKQAGKTAIKQGLDELRRLGDKHSDEVEKVCKMMLDDLFSNIPAQHLADVMDTLLRQLLHGSGDDVQALSKGSDSLSISSFVETVFESGLLRDPRGGRGALTAIVRAEAEGLCKLAEYFEALEIVPPEASAERLLNQSAYLKLSAARIWEEILMDLWEADKISREERRLLGPRDNTVFHAHLETNDAQDWLAFFISTLTGIHLTSQFSDGAVIKEVLQFRRSLTVLIPCYSEHIIYSCDYLRERSPRQMGLSNLECLVFTYRYEWMCFSERMLLSGYSWLDSPQDLLDAFLDDSYVDVGPATTQHVLELEVRLWATYRGQTVARTIRGTMAYRKVLRVLCRLQGHPEELVDELYQVVLTHQQFSNGGFLRNRPETVPDVEELIRRFDLQVSYDLIIKNAPEDRLNEVRSLLLRKGINQFDFFACFDCWQSLSCLRVPWSVAEWLDSLDMYSAERAHLFKEHDLTDVDSIRAVFTSTDTLPLTKFLQLLDLKDDQRQTLYENAHKLEWRSFLRYALPRRFGVVEMCPGSVRTQGKAGNQRIGLTFIKGQVLQALDANQDGSFGEALKMNMLMTQIDEGNRIVGFREHIFTRNEGAVGRFMAYAEFTFGTIFQRVLDSPLGVRLHYGHPDIMDAYWLRSHGVMSKASPNFNLNEDIFAAYDAVLQQERVTHSEMVEYGKGRETNFLGAAGFEAKLAAGAIAQTRSRDVYDLNYRLDGIRQFNLFYGSLGFYLCTLITVFSISLYVMSYALLSLNLTTRSDLGGLKTNLSGEWLLHIGFMLISPLLVELCLERGVQNGLKTIALDALLSTLFFVFHLQTKAHFMMGSLTTGKAAYVNTGRPLSMSRHSLVQAYKSFGASHYEPAVLLATLIFVYFMASSQLPDGSLPLYTVCMTVLSWLLSPVIFNPFPSAGDCHAEAREIWDWIAHGYVAEYRLKAADEDELKTRVKKEQMSDVSFDNFYTVQQVKRLSDLNDGSGLLWVVFYNLTMCMLLVCFVVMCLPPNAFAILLTIFGFWSVTASMFMLVPMLAGASKGKKKSGGGRFSISKAQRGPIMFFFKHLMWLVPLGACVFFIISWPTVGFDSTTILALLLNTAIMGYFQDAVFALLFWLLFRRMDKNEYTTMKQRDFFHHIELLFLRKRISVFIALAVASLQTLLGTALSVVKNMHTKIVLSADVSQRLSQGADSSLLSRPVSKFSTPHVTLSTERRIKKPGSLTKRPEEEDAPLLLDEDGEEKPAPPKRRAADVLKETFGQKGQQDNDGFQDFQ